MRSAHLLQLSTCHIKTSEEVYQVKPLLPRCHMPTLRSKSPGVKDSLRVVKLAVDFTCCRIIVVVYPPTLITGGRQNIRNGITIPVVCHSQVPVEPLLVANFNNIIHISVIISYSGLIFCRFLITSCSNHKY